MGKHMFALSMASRNDFIRGAARGIIDPTEGVEAMPSMELPGARINFRVIGEGEPLLMMRGYGSHAGWWAPELVSILEESFSLILYDHRGTGHSVHASGEYSISTLARDAAGLIGKLGFDKVNVFGLSMGGMVAQELAINHPALIKSLVLGGTHCGGLALIPPAAEVLQIMLARAQEAQPQGPNEALLATTFTPNFLHESPVAVAAYVRRAADRPTPPEIMALQAQAVAGWDSCDRLQAITAPTWILHGQFDAIVPAGNAFALQARIPSSRLLILPGMGHDFTAQSPAYTAWLLANILQLDETMKP